MKIINQLLTIAMVMTLSAPSLSHEDPVANPLQIAIGAFKSVIYDDLKGNKHLAPHIAKTKKEKLQICKHWLNQYSQLESKHNESNVMESCTAAGIDMSKYYTED